MRISKASRGFTLVELLVVIAIIGLLSSVVIVSVNSARAKARDSRRVQDAQALAIAIETYKDANNGNAPTDSGAFSTDLNVLVSGQYIARVPSDPRNSGDFVYVYDNVGSNDTYAISFVTEQASAQGAAGKYCQTSAGITGPLATVATACSEQ